MVTKQEAACNSGWLPRLESKAVWQRELHTDYNCGAWSKARGHRGIGNVKGQADAVAQWESACLACRRSCALSQHPSHRLDMTER